jgi:hypothetical protein
VAGLGRQGAGLAPAGHAAVDETPVAGEARIGSDAEALGDAGPPHFDEGVRPFDEAQDGLDSFGVLQVHADRTPAAVEHFACRA